jgi:hypothetical protein
LASLGPRAETLKQGTKRKRLGSIFWGLEFSGGLRLFGARSGALFGPRAETENKKFRKKNRREKRGARGICRFCHMVNPALQIVQIPLEYGYNRKSSLEFDLLITSPWIFKVF